jgi:hypothetical protein
MVGAAHCRLLLINEGDVVFRMTGHDAGLAARATVEVDRHAPLGRFFADLNEFFCHSALYAVAQAILPVRLLPSLFT